MAAWVSCELTFSRSALTRISDTAKGSFYANPLVDVPTEDAELIARYAAALVLATPFNTCTAARTTCGRTCGRVGSCLRWSRR
jgi:hypothetical protein